MARRTAPARGGKAIDVAPRDRKAMDELLGWMLLGHNPPDSMLVEGLAPAVPAIAGALRGVADQIEAAAPGDNDDTQAALEQVRDSRLADDHLGMLEARAHARSPRPTTLARAMVETLNLSAGELVIRRATRQELDQARDACIALRATVSEFADMHDLEVVLAAIGLMLGAGQVRLADERNRKE
jgi:hypothetical protein